MALHNNHPRNDTEFLVQKQARLELPLSLTDYLGESYERLQLSCGDGGVVSVLALPAQLQVKLLQRFPSGVVETRLDILLGIANILSEQVGGKRVEVSPRRNSEPFC